MHYVTPTHDRYATQTLTDKENVLHHHQFSQGHPYFQLYHITTQTTLIHTCVLLCMTRYRCDYGNIVCIFGRKFRSFPYFNSLTYKIIMIAAKPYFLENL